MDAFKYFGILNFFLKKISLLKMSRTPSIIFPSPNILNSWKGGKIYFAAVPKPLNFIETDSLKTFCNISIPIIASKHNNKHCKAWGMVARLYSKWRSVTSKRHGWCSVKEADLKGMLWRNIEHFLKKTQIWKIRIFWNELDEIFFFCFKRSLFLIFLKIWTPVFKFNFWLINLWRK